MGVLALGACAPMLCAVGLQTSGDINFEELARSSDDFNAAQLKAVSGGAPEED